MIIMFRFTTKLKDQGSIYLLMTNNIIVYKKLVKHYIEYTGVSHCTNK